MWTILNIGLCLYKGVVHYLNIPIRMELTDSQTLRLLTLNPPYNLSGMAVFHHPADPGGSRKSG